MVDFPEAEWRNNPDYRRQMIDDFVASGHRPFDSHGRN
jgi:hypothetical protein